MRAAVILTETSSVAREGAGAPTDPAPNHTPTNRRLHLAHTNALKLSWSSSCFQPGWSRRDQGDLMLVR